MSLADTYSKVKPACAGIGYLEKSGSGNMFISIGSGACVDPSGIIITAYHVISGHYEIKGGQITKSKSQNQELNVVLYRQLPDKHLIMFSTPVAVFASEDDDVALIKMPEVEGGYPSFDIPNNWKIREGDQIATAGYPLRSIYDDTSASPNLFTGVVSQIRPTFDEQRKAWSIDQIVLDLSVHPGNSGGPVFDVNSGELIGIISSQKLRESYLIEALKRLTEQDNDHQDTAAKAVPLVWTNITYCVPWTDFAGAIERFRAELQAQ